MTDEIEIVHYCGSNIHFSIKRKYIFIQENWEELQNLEHVYICYHLDQANWIWEGIIVNLQRIYLIYLKEEFILLMLAEISTLQYLPCPQNCASLILLNELYPKSFCTCL